VAKSKTAEKSDKPKKATTRRRKRGPAAPTGLSPAEMKVDPAPNVCTLCDEIQSDGGAVLVPYREPLGGRWVVLAALPLEQVDPTPYQRRLSDAHVKRLTDVIARTGRYLDPIIAVRVGEKKYQTPNGHHRASAMKAQGARAITALVVSEPEIARLILALNVEKAHNLREKSLEVIRLARELVSLPGVKESDFTLEFEEPAFLTLGLCYEQHGRFSGGAYNPILKRVDEFLDSPLSKALEQRNEHATRLLALDETVTAIVKSLQKKGLQSPYLRSFIVARLNPLRFRRGATMPIEKALDEMTKAAERFKTDKISPADLARSGGAPDSPAEA